MFSFLTADGNFFFLVAILIVMILAVLEGVLTVIGAGLSQFFDSVFPDGIGVEMDADLDIDASASSLSPAGFSSSLIAWLRLGKVPLIVSLVVLLVAFGLIGLLMQAVIVSLFGIMISKWIAIVPAFFASLPIMAVCNAGLSLILPKTETTAVSTETFVGRVAVITLGTAKVGEPAQAKLKDEHRKTHYVMVEPDMGVGEFTRGEKVLLTEQTEAGFRGIRPGETLH
ncbi:MAG: YqiJ family protein [Sneathiellales bacterium]|nr:YqiJ family protein [Sneathiellales bacterium]